MSNFVEIGPLVLVKKVFKVFYHIWAWQLSWSCGLYHVNEFLFPFFLNTYKQNLVEKRSVVSEKSKFIFSHLNDLDIQYLHLLTNSAVCIYHVSGHSLQYFLKINCYHFFSLEKPKLPNLTLSMNMSRSTHSQIWTNYDGLECQIIHTKFCRKSVAGSGNF